MFTPTSLRSQEVAIVEQNAMFYFVTANFNASVYSIVLEKLTRVLIKKAKSVGNTAAVNYRYKDNRIQTGSF